MDEVPWLKPARELIGLKEIVGSKDEPKVVEFFAAAGFPGVKDDETAWCAAFVNAMLARAGVKGTKSLAARSFLMWGRPVSEPVPGCIVVFWRVSPSAWQGHVAFFDHIAGDKIFVLGGNQGNAVSITGYPKSQLLGYRMPTLKEMPLVAQPAEVAAALPTQPKEIPDMALGDGKILGGILAGVVKGALDRQDVQITAPEVPHATKAVVDAIEDSPKVAVVEVKAAMASKINWMQIAMLGLGAAAYFGFNIPPEVREAALAGIIALGTVATFVIKTWFTKSVTPSSAGK